MKSKKFYAVRLYNSVGAPTAKYVFETLKAAIKCVEKFDAEWYVLLEAIHIDK